MHSLAKWQSNGVLNTTSYAGVFTPNQNHVQFSKLAITSPGMYILQVRMQSSDNVYRISCFSNTIRINASAADRNFDSQFQPNFIFSFSGKYEDIDVEQYKSMMYNYLTNLFGAVVVGDMYVYKDGNDSVGVAVNIVPDTEVYYNITNSSLATPDLVLPSLTLKSVSIYDQKYYVNTVIFADETTDATSVYDNIIFNTKFYFILNYVFF